MGVDNLGGVEYFSFCRKGKMKRIFYFAPPTEFITEETTVDTLKEVLKITTFQT